MKKLLLLLLIAPMVLSAGNKKQGATVDERVELLNIVSRLAGYQEYSSTEAKKYTDDINEYFAPYKEDTLIRFVKRLRNAVGLGYDAVATMSISLQGKGGQYALPENEEAMLSIYGGSMDNTGRWNQWNAPVFVKLLNDFYKKTNFNTFFKSHKKWYDAMTKRFDERVKFNRDWFHKFYGVKADSDYVIILGCGNGGSNYGPRTFDAKGKKTVYAVLGCWGFEEDGLPSFSAHREILIHEFNHSFSNPMVDASGAAEHLTASGKKIMAVVEESMKKQAYPYFKTVLYESMVRAAVIRYMRDNNFAEQDIKKQIMYENTRSFYWVEGLDSLLGVYSSSRDKYPTLLDFYPQIEAYFNNVAENIVSMSDEYLSHCPKVIEVSPDINGREDVDPSTEELKIVFDRPILMDVKNSVGIQILEGTDVFKGKAEKKGDYMVYHLNLKPDTQYDLRVIGFVPATSDGYYIQTYYISFHTSK